MNIQHYNQQKTRATNTFIHTTKSCWRRSCSRFPSGWNPIHHTWAMPTFRDPSAGASHSSSSIKSCSCRSKPLNLAAKICLVFSGLETRWCGFTGSDWLPFFLALLWRICYFCFLILALAMSCVIGMSFCFNFVHLSARLLSASSMLSTP